MFYMLRVYMPPACAPLICLPTAGEKNVRIDLRARMISSLSAAGVYFSLTNCGRPKKKNTILICIGWLAQYMMLCLCVLLRTIQIYHSDGSIRLPQ